MEEIIFTGFLSKINRSTISLETLLISMSQGIMVWKMVHSMMEHAHYCLMFINEHINQLITWSFFCH